MKLTVDIYNSKKNLFGNYGSYTSQEIKSKDLIYQVGNDNYQINWLKNKMCRQANDSYRLPKNYVGCDSYQINWHKNKMCRRSNDSYHLPKNYVGNDNYTCCTRINWREHKKGLLAGAGCGSPRLASYHLDGG